MSFARRFSIGALLMTMCAIIGLSALAFIVYLFTHPAIGLPVLVVAMILLTMPRADER